MIDYELIRSNRKSVSMSINNDLDVRIRAPHRVAVKDIEAFINKNLDWVEKHKKNMVERLASRPFRVFSEEEIKVLKKKAKEIIPERVSYYSAVMGVKPNCVKITSATTRWGSCSSKNNICFSYRLMQYPMEVIDYIVVHELTHIRVKNHGPLFYEELERFMPDHRERANMMK